MKILIDTNVLFSALLFPFSKPAQALEIAKDSASLFITTQNKREFLDTVGKKAPNLQDEAQVFLDKYSFRIISAHKQKITTIRDETDQPILDAAIERGIDIIITGDKDFLSLKSVRPLCLSPSEFISYARENGDLLTEQTIWHES